MTPLRDLYFFERTDVLPVFPESPCEDNLNLTMIIQLY